MIHGVLEREREEARSTLPLAVIEAIARGGVLQVDQGQTTALVGQIWPLPPAPVGHLKPRLVLIGL